MKLTLTDKNGNQVLTVESSGPVNKPYFIAWLDNLPEYIDDFHFKTKASKTELSGTLSTTWRKNDKCQTMFDVLKMLYPKDEIADWTKKFIFVGTIDTGDTLYVTDNKVYCTYHEDSISYKNTPDIKGAYNPIDIEKCLCWSNAKDFIKYIDNLIKTKNSKTLDLTK